MKNRAYSPSTQVSKYRRTAIRLDRAADGKINERENEKFM